MACIRDNYFVGTFTNSPINVFKLRSTELFSLSLIKSLVA